MQLPVLSLVLLVVICILNAVSQLLMRAGGADAVLAPNPDERPVAWLVASRWWLAGLALSWACGLGWAWCLRYVPLTLGLPLYSGLVYCLTIAGSLVLLGERVSVTQSLGIGLVFIGILLLLAPGTAGS